MEISLFENIQFKLIQTPKMSLSTITPTHLNSEKIPLEKNKSVFNFSLRLTVRMSAKL